MTMEMTINFYKLMSLLQEEVDEGEPAQYVAREFNDLTESYQNFMKKVSVSSVLLYKCFKLFP